MAAKVHFCVADNQFFRVNCYPRPTLLGANVPSPDGLGNERLGFGTTVRALRLVPARFRLRCPLMDPVRVGQCDRAEAHGRGFGAHLREGTAPGLSAGPGCPLLVAVRDPPVCRQWSRWLLEVGTVQTGDVSDLQFVFVHGSTRRSRAEAWPQQVGIPNAVFATMPGYGGETPVEFSQRRWEDTILGFCVGPSCVVAHSYGGPIAMSAARRRPDLIRALVLLEPAAYALARGVPAVGQHIDRMSPVLDRAPDLDPAEFWSLFMSAMTGQPPQPARSDEMHRAERQRLLPGPWTLSTPTDVAGDVPTLVLTGGWNDEYEAIADRIVGARHEVLPGFGHRPHDHPNATALMREHTAKASRIP